MSEENNGCVDNVIYLEKQKKKELFLKTVSLRFSTNYRRQTIW